MTHLLAAVLQSEREQRSSQTSHQSLHPENLSSRRDYRRHCTTGFRRFLNGTFLSIRTPRDGHEARQVTRSHMHSVLVQYWHEPHLPYPVCFVSESRADSQIFLWLLVGRCTAS